MWNVTLSFGIATLAASFAVVALPENEPPPVAQLVHWTGKTRAPVVESPSGSSRTRGEILMHRNGCLQCHSVDGSSKIGPSLKGVFGSVRIFRDGSTRVADEAYLRESILDPNARIVDGFAPGMPGFERTLRARDVDAIIDYLKTLDPVSPASSNSRASD